MKWVPCIGFSPANHKGFHQEGTFCRPLGFQLTLNLLTTDIVSRRFLEWLFGPGQTWDDLSWNLSRSKRAKLDRCVNRSICVKQTNRTWWSIYIQSDELSGTYHELKSLSLVLLLWSSTFGLVLRELFVKQKLFHLRKRHKRPVSSYRINTLTSTQARIEKLVD